MMNRFASLGLLSLALACSNPADSSLTMEDVAGTYVPTRLVTITGGVTTDQLAAGTMISLVLNSNGSTEGNLLVPGGNEDGSDYDVDLTGTWILSGSSVTLDHAADTFLRDMSYRFDNGQLDGAVVFGLTRLEITLTRQ